MKKATRTILTLLLIAGVLVLIGFVLNKNKASNDAKTAIVAAQDSNSIAVRIDTVKKQTLNLDFTANGNFEPYREMNFSAEKAGRVVKVFVDEGDHVSVGQTLATVRTDQLSVDLQNAQANLANAQRDKERYENAFTTGGVTQQQLDQANLMLVNAQAKVNMASINVGDANIRATISGVVNKRYIEPGAVLAAATQMFEIVDVSKLKLKVTVNESQVATLKLGDNVKVTASVFPDESFTGKITFIAPKADNSLNFPLEIEIASNPGNELKAGMYGTAVFAQPKAQSLMAIPRSAFVGGVNSNEVFIAENNTAARLRKVTAGRVIGDQVEVLDGLKEGEYVITSGQVNLADGSKIEIIK